MCTKVLFKCMTICVLQILQEIFCIRSMNEAKISIYSMVFAELQPYGFQQCARECETTAICEAFHFERNHLRCLLLISDDMPAIYTAYSKTYYSMKTRTAYNKYEPMASPVVTCAENTKSISFRNGNKACMQGCASPPMISKTMIYPTSVPYGYDLSRVGARVTYTCYSDYSFVGGPLTCSGDGLWAGVQEHFGCTVTSDLVCSSNSECEAAVTSSVCQDPFCTCPSDYAFIPHKSICSQDCKSLYSSGVYTNEWYYIKPDGQSPVLVYCINGWTEILIRTQGDTEFKQKSWHDYESGFGEGYYDYWVGLRHINALTYTPNEVHFTFTLKNGEIFTFHHWNFVVSDASDKYRMSVSEHCLSNQGRNDSSVTFYQSNHAQFSTHERDNDEEDQVSCAQFFGPWWFNNCPIKFKMMTADFDEMSITVAHTSSGVFQDVLLDRISVKVRRQT